MDKCFEKTFIGQSDELSIEVNYIITYGLFFYILQILVCFFLLIQNYIPVNLLLNAQIH